MAKGKSSKSTEIDWTAQGERFLQRLLDDETLRGTLLGAASSARSAYGRMSNGRGAGHQLFEDPELQRELLDVAGALRAATASLIEPAAAPQEKPKPKRRRRRGRAVLLVLVGAALAFALSEDLRSKALDLMFGAEEEFDYTSTTTPATPAPAGVGGAA